MPAVAIIAALNAATPTCFQIMLTSFFFNDFGSGKPAVRPAPRSSINFLTCALVLHT